MKLLNRFFAITLLSTALTPLIAHATPTVTFQGEVASQTCEATINGNENGTVLLPTVKTTDLATAGSTVGATPFTISVKDCTADPDNAVEISTRFLGQQVTDGGNLGNIATTNAASNVAIQLTKDSAGKNPITLNGVTNVEGLVLAKNETEASYNFGAQYISEAGGATAGTVTAVTEYTLSYQ